MYRPIRGSGIRLLIPLIFVLPGLSLILSPEANEPAWAFGAAFGLGRQELSDIDPQGQLALFMAVAFGYLIPWRIVSFLKFRQLT